MNNKEAISNSSILIYILKIWLFTSLISTIIFKLIEILEFGMSNFWTKIMFYLFYGLVYSIPATIILGIIIKVWTRNKLILIFISVFLIIGSFILFGLPINFNKPSTFIMPLIYSIVISFFIGIKKIKSN